MKNFLFIMFGGVGFVVVVVAFILVSAFLSNGPGGLFSAASALTTSPFAKPLPSYDLNVKMIVTVETPDGDVVASTVRNIVNAGTRKKANWPHGGNPASVRGEAVVIDLGARGTVFALINANADEARFYKAFTPPDGRPQSNETMAYYAQLPIGTSVELHPDNWPMFVTLTDITDPKSVTLVRGGRFNPETQKHDPVDDFEKMFGEGVKIKNVTLEITSDPVAWDNVRTSLPWFQDMYAKGARLNGSTSIAISTNELADNLGAGAFFMGEKK